MAFSFMLCTASPWRMRYNVLTRAGVRSCNAITRCNSLNESQQSDAIHGTPMWYAFQNSGVYLLWAVHQSKLGKNIWTTSKLLQYQAKSGGAKAMILQVSLLLSSSSSSHKLLPSLSSSYAIQWFAFPSHLSCHWQWKQRQDSSCWHVSCIFQTLDECFWQDVLKNFGADSIKILLVTS